MFNAARERNKQEVVNAAVQIGQRYNWNPQDLVAIVSYETSGKFGPWQAGPTTQWGQHRGLIQWGEPQQKAYGVTRDMSIAAQMEKVAEYLLDNGVQPGDGLLPMYAAVNAGDAKKTGATDANNGGRPGSVAEKVRGKEFAPHIERAQQLVDKYVNPSTMNGFSHLSLPDIIDGVTQLSGSGEIATPSPRPDPAGVPYSNYESRRAAAFSGLPQMAMAPGGIIDTGRAIVDGMDYTRAAADLQPGFDRYEADRNVMRSIPEMPSVPGGLFDARLEMAPGSMPAYSVNDRFADYQAPAPNSPEKAFENAVRNSYFDGIVNQPAPASAPAPGGFTPSSPMGATSRTPSGSFTPSSPFSNGLAPAGGLTPAPSKPSAPTIAPGSPQAQSLASAYGAYGTSRAMAPAAPVAPTANAIDVPNSAMSLADQYASYGAGKVAPQTAASATQAAPAPKPSETIQRQAVAAPAMTAAPRTVAPRTVTPYTPPTPTMTPERAKALGMVPTPNVPGAYMPNVAPNPAQVMRDQMGLIAANPLEALGRMVVGALQGGVFGPGLNNIQSFAGGLFGNLQAKAAEPATRQSIGYGLTAPSSGGLGGLGGGINGGNGAFQAGGGNWGNYTPGGGFNSGITTGSGFSYER